MEKLDGNTKDILKENIEKLKEVFPGVLTEDKINFEKLQEILGEDIEKGREIYEFTWPGKSESLKLSQKTSTGTLRPDKASSKDWDKTKNLYIEGDNLEVLKLLQRSYYKKVKMIYIDPPYNTGNDFVYKDDFRDNLRNYKELTLQSMKANPETSGRYHSDWLNMMYPRLRLARNLLRDDGVIFISIDDNEVHNLRKACDEVFGEENFIGNFVWRKKVGAGADSKLFFRQHESIILYGQDLSRIYSLFQPLTDKQKKEYSNPDNDYRGEWAPTDLSAPAHDNDDKRIYDIVSPTGKAYRKCWAYAYENLQKLLEGNLIWFGQDGNSMPKRKRFLKDKVGLTPRSWIDFCLTQDGKKDIDVIGLKGIFDYPKPVSLIKHFITIGCINSDIILDFFSGSATTAHAVMQLNAEDGGNRQFIMAQLPEPTDENSEAYKAGYKNISEIGMERIRRAGEKIKEENEDKEGIENLDTGFKVLKLDSSNIKRWDSSSDNLEEHLWDMVNPIKEDRFDEDIVYEIMVKYGIDLTLNIEEINIVNKKAYSIGEGYLIVCLDKNITLDVIEEIGKLRPERAVFLDSGFADDNVKINAVQILKKFGVEDFRSI